MEYRVLAKVTGVKFFSGEIDQKLIDVGTVFVEDKLDDRNGNAKGYATTAYKLGNSSGVKAFMEHVFPLQAELVMENRTMGKGQSQPVVLQVIPKIAGGKVS